MNISQSAYDSVWYEQTIELQRNLLSVITYQKPLILSFKCILSELSLRYYCSVSKFSNVNWNKLIENIYNQEIYTISVLV